MFAVEYRTTSCFGLVYPSRVCTLGAHKAATAREAVEYIALTTPNVEVLSVQYIGTGESL